jgi:adenylate kinase
MAQNAIGATMGPLLFLGAPGAGKGTQAREISKRLGIPHISTGEMFRENVTQRTALGNAVQAIMDKGELVPDELVNKMVKERLGWEDCRQGFLLDGYPRSVAQAEALHEILKEKGLKDPVVVNLHVSYNVIVERLSGRRVCPVCGRTYNLNSNPPLKDCVCDDDGTPLQLRSDDREEAVHERLSEYEARTAPVVDFYKRNGRFFEINADRSPEEITGALARVLQVP